MRYPIYHIAGGQEVGSGKIHLNKKFCRMIINADGHVKKKKSF